MLMHQIALFSWSFLREIDTYKPDVVDFRDLGTSDLAFLNLFATASPKIKLRIVPEVFSSFLEHC